MEVSAEKSKVMVNSQQNIQANILMDGVRLENVQEFKYLGSTLSSDGSCKNEIRIRTAMATSAMVRLQKNMEK